MEIIRNMIARFFTAAFLFVYSFNGLAQNPGKYLIRFTDKKNNNYTIENPQEFLTERALLRRTKQNIPINFNDLPVSQIYIDSLVAAGIPVVNRSKWFNSVTTDEIGLGEVNRILQFSFVKDIQLIKPSYGFNSFNGSSGVNSINSASEINYGYAFRQIEIHNGDILHKSGYTGEGIQIAIIDAGFNNTDTMSAFNRLWSNGQILGNRDFVQPNNSDVFNKSSHGTLVLSVIGGYLPGLYSGTAPDASFWLLRSEDTGSEYPIEEYNWVSAAEFADSVGADVINSSLGYSEFDDPSMSYTYTDMNGNTAPVSIAADIAVSKGMVVVVSAGNQGDDEWKYISAPADADSVLAVAAVKMDGTITGFSSRGPSSDGEIKPNISAVGGGTFTISPSGNIGQSNGTSLSAPVITGLVACLWQSNPDATNMEVKKVIEESCDRFESPDTVYGFGIPDFYKANVILKMNSKIENNKFSNIEFFPNPFSDYSVLAFFSTSAGNGKIEVYNLLGGIVENFWVEINEGLNIPEISRLALLNPGVYILQFEFDSKKYKKKIIKF